MASPAHAFFCFEVLAASYDNSRHPDLKSILDKYERSRLETTQVSDTDIVNGAVDKAHPTVRSSASGNQVVPQSPSISRIQASSSPSRSVSSTPLSTSANSSNSQVASSSTSDIMRESYASRLAVTDSYPMFVTWNSLSRSGNKSLRGCIGTFEPLPLEKGLEQYALTSAFEDTRFSPIPASLLPHLSCSLTLLADFEDCKHALDWTLEEHGIRISFMHRYRRYGATYLPDVAIEQGWSKEETLESLMRKAGWESGSRRLLKSSSKPWEEVKDFHVVRYTGLKTTASYAEWQEWKENIDS